MLDETKYFHEVIQGHGLIVTEVRVMRTDREPISREEAEEIVSSLEQNFPREIYRIGSQLKPSEDNVVLHVYINLQSDEAFRRSGTINARVIVPREEVENRLSDSPN